MGNHTSVRNWKQTLSDWELVKRRTAASGAVGAQPTAGSTSERVTNRYARKRASRSLSPTSVTPSRTLRSAGSKATPTTSSSPALVSHCMIKLWPALIRPAALRTA